MNPLNRIEILVVEDNPDDLAMTVRALEKAKLANHVQVARDGVEALEFIFCREAFSHRRIEDRPKLVLLDLKLPRVDGLEVLKAIKSDPRTKIIPVVVMTSSNEQSDVIKSYQLGVNSYVFKPVNFDHFAKAVQELGIYWMLLNLNPAGKG